MIDDPIVAEVRKARAELFKEHGCSLERLFEHFKKMETEHMTTDGRYMPSDNVVSRVAEEPPEYKTGND